MSFKSYASQPVTRLAHCIKSLDEIVQVDNQTMRYEPAPGAVHLFKFFQEIKVGDYIVYLTDEDKYHCSAEVFATRNIVPETK